MHCVKGYTVPVLVIHSAVLIVSKSPYIAAILFCNFRIHSLQEPASPEKTSSLSASCRNTSRPCTARPSDRCHSGAPPHVRLRGPGTEGRRLSLPALPRRAGGGAVRQRSLMSGCSIATYPGQCVRGQSVPAVTHYLTSQIMSALQ